MRNNDTELYKQMVEHFEKQLEMVNYWLAFAEAKNGAIIAINVAIMAVMISLFEQAPIMCVLVISCFSISSIWSLISFCPNMKNRPDGNNFTIDNCEKNLLFYGDIASLETTEQYIELTCDRYFEDTINMQIDIDKLIYDLASEIVINSQITKKKYSKFRQALKVDFIAIVLSIIFLVVA